MMKFLIFVFILYGILQADTRGIKPIHYIDKRENKIDLYNNSYAIVIGINEYKEIPSLDAAVSDAMKVSALLQNRGMKVTQLIDHQATRKNIAKAIGDVMHNISKANDRVLIYFAGHGVATGDKGSKMGYILPYDAELNYPRATGISMREINGWTAGYKAKHVMFVADSCYSGLNLKTRSVPKSDTIPDYIRVIAREPIRISMTAGSSNQEAHEYKGHGLFTYFFLEGLTGKADRNDDGIITSYELVNYIQPNVIHTAQAEFKSFQTPLMGRSGEGEFVFLTPKQIEDQATVKDVDVFVGF
jgi:hypothetical protein